MQTHACDTIGVSNRGVLEGIRDDLQVTRLRLKTWTVHPIGVDKKVLVQWIRSHSREINENAVDRDSVALPLIGKAVVIGIIRQSCQVVQVRHRAVDGLRKNPPHL